MIREIYTCPMHPEVQREQRGFCSKCGMILQKAKEQKKKEYKSCC